MSHEYAAHIRLLSRLLSELKRPHAIKGNRVSIILNPQFRTKEHSLVGVVLLGVAERASFGYEFFDLSYSQEPILESYTLGRTAMQLKIDLMHFIEDRRLLERFFDHAERAEKLTARSIDTDRFKEYVRHRFATADDQTFMKMVLAWMDNGMWTCPTEEDILSLAALRGKDREVAMLFKSYAAADVLRE